MLKYIVLLSLLFLCISAKGPNNSNQKPQKSANHPANFANHPANFGNPRPKFNPRPYFANPPPKVANPPPQVANPPPKVANPPPKVANPPPQVANPPPQVANPPPKVANPPPQVANPPPQVANPPPKVANPPPQVANPPANVANPPPQVANPPPQVANPPPQVANPPASSNSAAQIDVQKYRSYNGTFNNLANNLYGSASIPLLRKLPIKYDDGYSIPTGGFPSRLVSTRLVSNLLFNRKIEYDVPAEADTSFLFTMWGQFTDHDVTFSWDSSFFSTPTDNQCVPFPIPIPKGDPVFDSYNNGGQTMGFCRASIVKGTGTAPGNPIQVPNFVTAWIDGSQVYGPTNARTQVLRAWKGGLMLTSKGVDGDYLPINCVGTTTTTLLVMANANKVPSYDLFGAGDFRANENAVLLSLQTLFMREHNRRAAKYYATSNNDEEAFQNARKMIMAHIQKITYEDYLPIVLGKALPTYNGYDPSVNPNIAEFFSTVAFRFGHDQLPNILPRLDPNGVSIPEGAVLLRDAFFDVDSFKPFGASCFLRGAALSSSRPVDAIFEDDIRQFLFGIGAATATDLAARNMQRARDMGIGFYNDARVAYGLTPCTTFSCVTDDSQAATILNQLYGQDNVDYLDCFAGGLLETKLPNAKVGPLFAAAISDQFERIRDGDRYFYLNPGVLTADELAEIQSTTLADIIHRNTDSKQALPRQVFSRSNLNAAGVTSSSSSSSWSTAQIVAVVIPSAVAGILIIVVIALLFVIKKKETKSTNPAYYENLVDNQPNYY
jgi:peroxidase